MPCGCWSCRRRCLTRAGGCASSNSSRGDALLDRITRYLDARRLLGTRLAVGPPFYQGVTVVATLHAFRGAETDRSRGRPATLSTATSTR